MLWSVLIAVIRTSKSKITQSLYFTALNRITKRHFAVDVRRSYGILWDRHLVDPMGQTL